MYDNKITSSTTKKTVEKKDANIARKENTKPVEKEKAKVEEKPTKIAVYSSGNIYHPSLGRIEKGYSVLDPEVANAWMNISKKIRKATPEEVAMAYGV